MYPFKIVPVSHKFSAKIKRNKKDTFGNRIIEQVATGVGPCRVSLKPFVPGKDHRILFSYSPFEIENPYNQIGPIFIHKKDVEEYSDIHRFPAEIKADKKNFPLTIIGYDRKQIMNFTRRVGEDDVDELISDIFQKYPEVQFLHARNSEACCYICKIERI